MNRIVSILVLCLFVGLCCAQSYPFKPGFPYPVPTAVVNLDTAPEQRWTSLVQQIVAQHGWEYSYAMVQAYYDTQVPAAVRPIVEYISANAEKVLDAEYVAEITGVWQALLPFAPSQKNFTLAHMMALNLMYEFSSACTSIVAQASNGSIWHGRNLDWGTPDGVDFANFTYLVSFQQGGSEIYRSVHFVGFVGALSVMRTGDFAITIDERNLPDAVVNELENLARMERGVTPVTWLARLAAQNNATYAEAVTTLSTANIVAPVYYIISGTQPNEGAVITRNWNETVNGVWSIPNGPEPWYVVETNYDHWDTPPGNDNRRATAEWALSKIGQAGVNAEGIYTVMSTGDVNGNRGVLNSYTRYTIVVNPAAGTFGAWNMN